jgi:hypothetical protein
MPRTPDSRISAKVIFFWRATSGMPHDSADRAGSEATRAWAFAAGSRYGAVRPWIRPAPAYSSPARRRGIYLNQSLEIVGCRR